MFSSHPENRPPRVHTYTGELSYLLNEGVDAQQTPNPQYSQQHVERSHSLDVLTAATEHRYPDSYQHPPEQHQNQQTQSPRSRRRASSLSFLKPVSSRGLLSEDLLTELDPDDVDHPPTTPTLLPGSGSGVRRRRSSSGSREMLVAGGVVAGGGSGAGKGNAGGLDKASGDSDDHEKGDSGGPDNREGTGAGMDGTNTVNEESHINMNDPCGILSFTDVVVGVLTFLMSVVVFVSIGDSIFAGVEAKQKAYIGVSMCIFPAALLGWILTLVSHVPWTVPSVDVTFSPILAEMGTALADRLHHTADTDALVPTFVAAISICYVCVGLSLSMVGHFRISTLTNYIPQQVVAGFLAGTGLQLVANSLRMTAGLAGPESLWLVLTEPECFQRIAPAILLTALLRTAHLKEWRFLPASFSVPALLLSATVIFQAIAVLRGVSFDECIDNGWFFAWPENVVAKTPRYWNWIALNFNPSYQHNGWLDSVNWRALCETCPPYFATASIIGVLKLAIKATAFSTIFQREIGADRELVTLGVLNVACGLLGCSGIHWSFSVSPYICLKSTMRQNECPFPFDVDILFFVCYEQI